MYLLPNQMPEGSYLKILSRKRISLLRINISDHSSLFGKAIASSFRPETVATSGKAHPNCCEGEEHGLQVQTAS